MSTADEDYEPVFIQYGEYPNIYFHWQRRLDVRGMKFPYECMRCHRAHDVAKVTPTGRYLDCTTWRCPNCGSLIDDRPLGIGGGSARPLNEHGLPR